MKYEIFLPWKKTDVERAQWEIVQFCNTMGYSAPEMNFNTDLDSEGDVLLIYLDKNDKLWSLLKPKLKKIFPLFRYYDLEPYGYPSHIGCIFPKNRVAFDLRIGTEAENKNS